MRNVLVTGGSGFIGRHLVQSLMSDGLEVTLLIREERTDDAQPLFGTCRTTTLEQLASVEKFDFDTVFHLATKYVFEHTHEQCSELIASNVLLITRIADLAARQTHDISIVNVSTFMQHYRGLDYGPTCLYAATKQAAEDILSYFSLRKNLSIKTLVLPHVYGESDTRKKLVNLLVEASESSEPLHLSSGRQVMDLVHVDDAVDALLRVASMDRGRWAVSSGDSVTIRELVGIANDAAQQSLMTHFDSNRDREMDQYEEWKTAPLLPGWSPKVQLRTWLKSQVQTRLGGESH